MLPIHSILHPTDFSEHSDYAFRLACSLARDYGARIVVVHVAAPLAVVYEGGVVIPYPEDYRLEMRAKLQEVRPSDPGVSVERRLTEGDPATEIVKATREEGCDLIVMGTHGRRGLGRLLMGSVAENVLRRATCPVLTVKTPFPAAAGVPDGSRAEEPLELTNA